MERLFSFLVVAGCCAAFSLGCGSAEWEDVECVSFTLSVPDSGAVGETVSARVTGTSGAPPCCRFEGVLSRLDSAGHWVLEPKASCRKGRGGCPDSDYFFDETVTIVPQRPGLMRVKVISYGDDLLDSLLVVE